ncbi:hypothetical protein L7F22_001555 [Adiantum nelumboides]|nr:hypothetical protein [Adiantum nelumboides]
MPPACRTSKKWKPMAEQKRVLEAVFRRESRHGLRPGDDPSPQSLRQLTARMRRLQPEGHEEEEEEVQQESVRGWLRDRQAREDMADMRCQVAELLEEHWAAKKSALKRPVQYSNAGPNNALHISAPSALVSGPATSSSHTGATHDDNIAASLSLHIMRKQVGAAVPLHVPRRIYCCAAAQVPAATYNSTDLNGELQAIGLPCLPMPAPAGLPAGNSCAAVESASAHDHLLNTTPLALPLLPLPSVPRASWLN